MSEQFTPGPWTYAGEIRNFVGDHWEAREHISVGNGDRIVADLRGENIHANARLIAAAPELLEACKKAATCASIPDYVMDLLRAAIAKARGAQS